MRDTRKLARLTIRSTRSRASGALFRQAAVAMNAGATLLVTANSRDDSCSEVKTRVNLYVVESRLYHLFMSSKSHTIEDTTSTSAVVDARARISCCMSSGSDCQLVVLFTEVLFTNVYSG